MKVMMMNLIRTCTSLIILILMFTSQSSAKFDPKTLVGAWLFDGNAKDASGNGKDGTLENGPKWAAGKFGQALEFNGGKKSYVNVGNLDLKGPVTLVFWAKPDGAKDDDRLISNINGPAVPAFTIRFMPPKVEIWSSTWQAVIEKFEDNQWGHYAFVFENTGAGAGQKEDVTGYYNGKEGLTVKDDFAFTDIGIGAHFIENWGQYFTGLLDDVAFFDVTLTVADIKNIMNKGLKISLSVSAAGKLATSWGSLKAQY